MNDDQDRITQPLGIFARPEPVAGYGPAELVAALLAVVWVVAVVAYVSLLPATDGRGLLGIVMTLLVVFLPLALIWASVTTLRSVRELRTEAARLQSTVEAMRNAYLVNQQTTAAMKPVVEQKIDELTAATKEVTATFQSRRDTALTVPSADRKSAMAAPRPQPADEQPALALGTPADELRPPLGIAEFLRALNFPEGPDDKDGFRALRMALEDRNVAKLIRAAQDVLTLLAQEGIYMDDLKPDRARPELWRRFVAGERGGQISGLGGVRDRSSLALTAGRMREDTIFRDAAHHFMRTFDKTLQQFEKEASDTDLAALSDTRTARAFMLFGRVAGVFD
jgi:Sec-independent protein translocase protein TatA